jgi:hypothetical protein
VAAVLAEQHDEWAEGHRYLGLDLILRAGTKPPPLIRREPCPSSSWVRAGRRDGFVQPGVGVGSDQHYPLSAAGDQVREGGVPRRPGLGRGALDAEHFPVALGVHPGRDQHNSVHHPACFAHLHRQRATKRTARHHRAARYGTRPLVRPSASLEGSRGARAHVPRHAVPGSRGSRYTTIRDATLGGVCRSDRNVPPHGWCPSWLEPAPGD